MVAGLLYVVGLIAVVATLVVAGFGAPGLIQMVNAALDTPGSDLLGTLISVARLMEWAVLPIVGGLVLMGLGRIIMLLGVHQPQPARPGLIRPRKRAARGPPVRSGHRERRRAQARGCGTMRR